MTQPSHKQLTRHVSVMLFCQCQVGSTGREAVEQGCVSVRVSVRVGVRVSVRVSVRVG